MKRVWKVIRADGSWLRATGQIHPEGFFLLTGEAYQPGQSKPRGTFHDQILAEFPELQILSDLHLSDKDGVPRQAVEDAWYFSGRTERGQSNPWALARHLRITEDEAFNLIFCDLYNDKGVFTEYVHSHRPRWAQEAGRARELLQ